MDHEQPHIVAAEKPQWFKSPLASDRLRRPSEAQPAASDLFKNTDRAADEQGHGGSDSYDGYPPFQRYEEPTLLEIFYDLFFAANYNVFAQNQAVTNHQRFKAYVGYFSLLWGTWLVVTLYDVRYVTDSVFERVARAVQLGVLVGFTVVAPNFNPEDQDQTTMMTMSLMLFLSRLCLAIEYAHTLAQIYKFKRARRPFYFQIAINAVSALVYLGITFRFQGKQSRVYITWYIFTAGEAILSLVMSNYWKTLSFTRTHLMKRLSLITVMILGESIQTVAQNIATMVKTPAAWNSFTIGMITAASGTIYFVFLVYFDWMRHLQLPALRQQIWTALHYPFHLSLVLFMRGFTQLILFGKAFNVFNTLSDNWVYDPSPGARTLDIDVFDMTSSAIADSLANETNQIFDLYPPPDLVTRVVVNHSIANISTIPDATWANLQKYYSAAATNESAVLDDNTLNGFLTLMEQAIVIFSAIANSVSKSFGIDVSGEVKAKQPSDNNPLKLSENEVTISDKTNQRARLVFAYTYVACGCTLILLVMMALVSRMSPLGRLPRLRFVICTLFGIGIALTAVLFFAPNKADSFLLTAWPIPAIALGWFVVTVLVHVRGSAGGGRTRSALDTVRNILGLFRPRRRNKEAGRQPDDDGDSQRVILRVWPPTRENTDLSAAETLKSAAGGAAAPRGRRVSFRDVSPKGAPRLDSPDSSGLRNADHDHRKADGSERV
ncbi:hypothetical protein LLEC1_02952 [Akanthomyces lecanii]|uniref:Low temperature requirement A n=1 Tax=Cordyceps confragosa TaxID=2714763 RepID=A0A179I703_CORDF|nr:hypothetical protein LLEC1_02952 [Akanthomyces lecanii]